MCYRHTKYSIPNCITLKVNSHKATKRWNNALTLYKRSILWFFFYAKGEILIFIIFTKM